MFGAVVSVSCQTLCCQSVFVTLRQDPTLDRRDDIFKGNGGLLTNPKPAAHPAEFPIA
jgi:hypothetical protein